jgi:hypothetical protein
MDLHWRLKRLRNARRGLGAHPFAVAGPSAQQTVDIFEGQWITAFPDELDVKAGWVNHFDPEIDARVPWVDSVIPDGLAGRSVLELGPFEAYQTWMLEQKGARVTAVEASRTAYLKCLVVKELLGISAPFVYSDALAYLDACRDHFDVVWASGILYHQADPLGFLERAAAKGDHLFLHTHYYDQSLRATSEAGRFDERRDLRVIWHGREMVLHHRDYVGDVFLGNFAGGPRPFSLWMERDDIEFVLREAGLTAISYGVLDPGNPAGPAFYLLASREGTTE